jgi:hypothetical protein
VARECNPKNSDLDYLPPNIFQGINFNHKEIKSMETHSRISEIFRSMKKRCYNPKNRNFKNYGSRGIKLCEEWNSRELVKISGFHYTKGYLAFKKWALENGYKDGLTIDRIDNEKGYSPENCRWVTIKEQANNKRSNRFITYKGKTQTMKQWCEELNLNYGTIKERITKSNWDCKKAFETPVKTRPILT